MAHFFSNTAAPSTGAGALCLTHATANSSIAAKQAQLAYLIDPVLLLKTRLRPPSSLYLRMKQVRRADVKTGEEE